MTILGIYILVSLGFVALAMAEFAFILLLNRRMSVSTNANKDLGIRKKEKKGYPAKMRSKVKVNTNMNKAPKSVANQGVQIPPSHIIDVAAFCVHFVAFLVFNVMYWGTDTIKKMI